MLEPETFLPLDYIQANPLKKRPRSISNPRGVNLLYDVLQFEPSDIKRAVLFVTNNYSLVCETPEDAMKVAYEMEDGQRYDAVMGHLTRSRELFQFKRFYICRKHITWRIPEVNTSFYITEEVTDSTERSHLGAEDISRVQEGQDKPQEQSGHHCREERCGEGGGGRHFVQDRGGQGQDARTKL